MGTLSEFLEQQADQQATYRAAADRRRDEWVASVARLVDRIRTWLADADPKGILSIRDETFHIRERGIGDYDAPGLLIGLGLTEVRVEPIARTVAGRYSWTGRLTMTNAFGRVDMSNDRYRYMMFRTKRTGGDGWFLIKEESSTGAPLDREGFEEALQDLLE